MPTFTAPPLPMMVLVPSLDRAGAGMAGAGPGPGAGAGAVACPGGW